jgi:hypothetical protein
VADDQMCPGLSGKERTHLVIDEQLGLNWHRHVFKASIEPPYVNLTKEMKRADDLG